MYYLNGVISSEELLNEDFFYGYSLFETMYGIDGKVLFLNEHINRMLESAKLIGINIKNDIDKDINNFIEKFGKMEEFMFKIQVSNNNFYMKILKFSGREADEGITASFVKKYYQNEMGFVKSANYLGNILAKKELESFEGVFTNRQGIITEGTMSNLFFIKNEILYTPSLDLNILPGVTRGIIIKISNSLGIKVQEGHFYKKDLLESDSMFFTNSLMKIGLLWVSEFENIKKNKTKEIHKLEKEYYKLIRDMI